MVLKYEIILREIFETKHGLLYISFNSQIPIELYLPWYKFIAFH